MRAAKIAGAMFLGLVLLPMILAGVVLAAGEPVLRWAVEGPLSRAAGQQIRIEGPLSITWGLPTRVVAENVHVANARWGSRPDLFVAQRLEVEIFPATLLDRRSHLPLVSIEHALLLFETSSGGQSNWRFLRELLKTTSRRAFPVLDHILLRDGRVVFHNGATEAERDLTAERLEIDAPDSAGPARLTAQARFNDLPARLAGTVGPLADLRSPPRPYPVDLTASLGDSSIKLQGTAARPLDLSGIEARLRLSGRHARDVAAALGLSLPRFPDFQAEGDLSGGGENWRLSAVTLTLDHSRLAGSLALERPPDRVPHFQAELTSSVIDLDDIAGLLDGRRPAPAASSPAGSADGKRPMLPATPFPASALAGIDADIDIAVDRVTGGPPLRRLSAALRLRNGVLTLRPLSVGLAGGEARAELAYDTRAAPFPLTLDLDLRRIDLQQLVSGPALSARFGEARGTAGGVFHIRSAGASLRELLERMEGEAALVLDQGRFGRILRAIAGPDVVNALDLAATDDRPPAVNCLIARFDIAKGIATASTLLADTDAVMLIGKGGFNFAAETIYLDVTPYHKHVAPSTSRTPVEMRGTFAAPSIAVSKAEIQERFGRTLSLDMLAPPSLQPIIDAGLGPGSACNSAVQLPPSEPPGVGSSEPAKQ